MGPRPANRPAGRPGRSARNRNLTARALSQTMKTYFQYLPVSVQNIDWGLYLTAVGTESVPPGCETYPSTTHPSMYDFTWKDGRVLAEYQLLYLRSEEHTSELQSRQYLVCR